MRAMAIDGFGGPDQLKPVQVPRPAPDKGEILIHVVSAGVNPVDCMIRAGQLADTLPHAFPLIPGWDAAGVVEELGAGASRFRKGERVWAFARKPVVQWGCYAEYVAVPETQAALMPAKLLFEEAAAVPVAAMTAHQCLADLGKGQTVLIHGAAGGVGHFAVQLAKLVGARVFATAGTSNQAFVIGLGAEVGIDYTKEDFVEAVRRHSPEGFDLVVDTVGGETLSRSYEALRPGGQLVSIVDEPDAGLAERRGVRARALRMESNAETLKHLAQLFDQKRIKVHVQRIFNLSDAAVAHRLVEQRHVQGKLVLNI